MLSAGPVETAMVQRVMELKDKLDFSQADDLSKQLFQKFIDNAAPKYQSVDEIADLIKTILQTHKPHFRYLSNEEFAPSVFKAKFVDLSGDSVISKISQRFFGETN